MACWGLGDGHYFWRLVVFGVGWRRRESGDLVRLFSMWAIANVTQENLLET